MPDQMGYRVNPAEFKSAPFEPGEAFAWAFALWREEPQRVALPLVVLSLVLVTAGTFVPAVLSGIVLAVADSDSTVLLWVARLLSGIINVVVGGYVFSAAYPFVLNVARGRPVVFADLFRCGHLFARTLVTVFIISIVVGLGSALCVLPGAFGCVAACMAVPLLIDQDVAPIDALHKSWNLVQPLLVPISIFCLLSFLAVVAGMLLCFAGAVFVSLPVVFLAHAYVYLRLMGETPINT